MKRLVAVILCLFTLGLAAPGLTQSLVLDKRSVPIQGFAPDPTKSQNHAVADAATYDLAVTNWTVVKFYSDQEIKVKLNDNTAYYRSYGGTYVLDPAVTSMKFYNDSGSTANIDIEGM